MQIVDTDKYRVKPGTQVDLSTISTDEDGGLGKSQGKDAFHKLVRRMQELQELMFAEGKHALLVVLQAMDAGGKDSTIRKVFGPINPEGCYAVAFKSPTAAELNRDFLWRIHQHTPEKGRMAIFNRSHYEDVLIALVQDLVERERGQKRYEHINNFEKMLNDEGTVVLKFYLHISKDYQKERLQRRLERPDKWWKFEPADLNERKKWDEYHEAHQVAISRTSHDWAPWYIIPAENRWYRNLLIAQTLVETLESLNMQLPEPKFDPTQFVVD